MTTKHKYDCKMAFGKKDSSCPRCQELINGAPIRNEWQKPYFAQKKFNEQMELDAIRNHCCIKSKCSVVCTFGDY
jgi:hypothetical protein